MRNCSRAAPPTLALVKAAGADHPYYQIGSGATQAIFLIRLAARAEPVTIYKVINVSSSKRIEHDLKGILRGEARFDALSRALYSTDASNYQLRPMGVVLPADERDVIALMQYASAYKIPLHPRGAGSGLAGEALGRGIVVDTSKYMRGIESVDGAGCVVQAGVVLESLNARARARGLHFGPDPSSASRCTLGGMIANNATGAHSLMYGYTADHIESLDVVFADGTAATVSAADLHGAAFAEWRCRDNILGRAASTLPELLARHRELIAEKKPKCARNRSGYALDKTLVNGTFDFCRLLAGSEGTLAFVTRAKLRLVPLPAARCLVLLTFDSIGKAARCVSMLLDLDPSAIELLDGFVIQSARETGRTYGELLPPATRSVLLVEFYGKSRAALEDRARAVVALAVEKLRLANGSVVAHDEERMRLFWSLRNAGNPLLYRGRGPRQSTTFIEDAAVDPEDLPEYLSELDRILRSEGIQYATFGHAAHGELHTRPFLDLRNERDIHRMERIADQVYEVVLRLGGTISGEHGDGLARVQYIPRQYGELVEIFRQVKQTLDPQGILNPGKKLSSDAHAIRHNLRYGASYTWKPAPTALLWDKGELQYEVEKCNGCAECRQVGSGVSMCPIYRVTLDEEASPRAKANLMRLFATGQLDEQWRFSDEFKRIADLCVNCKMCHLECSSQVNIPKLMLEAKAAWAEKNSQPVVNQVLIRSELLARLGSWTAWPANFSLRNRLFRRLLEAVTGIDQRRWLPSFAARPFLRRAQQSAAAAPTRGKLAYFIDLFANYNDPDLGQAVVDVLRHNGYEVIVPRGQKGCAMPQIDYGAKKQALPQIKHNIRLLADVIRDGYTVVSSEPTATLCLQEEYLAYDNSPDARLVAEHTRDVCDVLRELQQAGELAAFSRRLDVVFGYHAPCHLKALKIGRPGMTLVQGIEGVTVEYIDAGCCGIAGTFGFKKSAFDLSMRVGQGLFEGLKQQHITYGLSECSACKMQMEQGSGKPTLHPIKVLAYAYGLLDDLPGMTLLGKRWEKRPDRWDPVAKG